jgi:hypothetical protein
MTSGDGGRTWGVPEPIWSVRGAVTNLRLHRDGAGALHLLWTEGFVSMHHIHQDSTGTWTRSEQGGGPDVFAFSGVSGINQCGRLAVARVVVGADGEFRLHVMEWVDGQWRSSEGLSGTQAIYVFDGTGPTGAWFVGWSGPGEGRAGPLVWTARF